MATKCFNCALDLHFAAGVPLHLQMCPRCNVRQDCRPLADDPLTVTLTRGEVMLILAQVRKESARRDERPGDACDSIARRLAPIGDPEWGESLTAPVTISLTLTPPPEWEERAVARAKREGVI